MNFLTFCNHWETYQKHQIQSLSKHPRRNQHRSYTFKGVKKFRVCLSQLDQWGTSTTRCSLRSRSINGKILKDVCQLTLPIVNYSPYPETPAIVVLMVLIHRFKLMLMVSINLQSKLGWGICHSSQLRQLNNLIKIHNKTAETWLHFWVASYQRCLNSFTNKILITIIVICYTAVKVNCERQGSGPISSSKVFRSNQ